MASWRTRGLSAPSRPNILFITTDDMNCDSVGVFDCGVPDTTPNIDGLARQGVRFTYAHVQVANCVPSRNVMQTGRYPHSSGVEGFYKVKPDFPILPDVLKENGYFIGIKDKVSHSTPYHPYPWDLVMQRSAEKGAARSPKSFHEFVRQGIARSREARKPFYLVANITDPHKPFYGEARSKQSGFDNFPPSKTYDVDTIPVPGFLPDLPEVRLEVKRYYDSVRRADDCVGAALRALRESGEADSTVVMFLSDHGMPFPFAKTNVYHHSTRTPWIVRWPRMVRAGTVDDQHMISAIDFMPTILDITGIAPPEGLQGRSFAPILKGRKQSGRDHIIKEYNENAGGGRHPMRAVETRRFCYIFNPWSNGERVFRTATQGTTTYKLMQTLAETDTKVAARLEHFDHRTLEEFYDVENDRDSLHNLIDDPRHARDIDRLRGTLEAWMVKTGDPCLEVFRRRDDLAFREAFMRQQQDASNERRKKARPKQPRPGRRRGLIAVTPPEGIQRGRTTLVIINHTLPPRLGKQLLHVMLKDQDGRRIQRRVLTIRGEGNAAVEFDVPSRDTLTQIVVAAFVGKDFQSCLQHIVSRPVPVR
jgi:N-sulfoglucosamine sulfohydrolase